MHRNLRRFRACVNKRVFQASVNFALCTIIVVFLIERRLRLLACDLRPISEDRRTTPIRDWRAFWSQAYLDPRLRWTSTISLSRHTGRCAEQTRRTFWASAKICFLFRKGVHYWFRTRAHSALLDALFAVRAMREMRRFREDIGLEHLCILNHSA